jgi:broad specificity phosphatase PhoE
MKTIYLVRHGETESNVASLVQDGTSVLSEKGKRQAEVLAERLRHLKHDHILVSDYIRTRQTVEPFLQYTSIEPAYTHLVRETKRPSQYIGINSESEEYQAYLKLTDEKIFDESWRHSDEENFHDVIARIKEFFLYIESIEGDTIVVSHGKFITYVTMYVIMSGHLTPDIWLHAKHSFQPLNTGITMLRYDDKHQHWALRTFNDHAHFAE